MEIKWVAELPGKPPQIRRPRSYTPREGSADLYEHAAALLENPMAWAEYPRELKSPRYAQKLCNALQEGTIAAYSPDLGFEAVYRSVTGKIYVRHNPEASSPTRVAFTQGVEHGRLKALEEVKKLNSDFHQSLIGLEGWPY
jgi:hypothetical protein